MQYKKIKDTYVVRIDKGEEVIAKLKEFCEKKNIKAGSITAIGAAKNVKLGYFDTSSKEYYVKEFEESHEIAGLTGNITKKDGKPYLHCHIVIAGKDYKCQGGHLDSAMVSGAFEAIVQIIEGEIDREFDDDIGLNLIKV
jgi:uncharacterized protein